MITRKPGLDTLLNVVILLALIALATAFLIGRQVGRPQSTPAPMDKLARMDDDTGTFRIVTAAGDTTDADVWASSRLLVIYSTTCPYCEMSVQSWRRLIQRACGDANILLVSAEPIRRQTNYWARRGNPGEQCQSARVVQALDANLVEQHYGVMGTPTYIAVGRSGKVAQRFVGALLDDSGIDRVLRALR